MLIKLEDKWSPVDLHTILEVGTSVPVPNDLSLSHSYTTLCLTNFHFKQTMDLETSLHQL